MERQKDFSKMSMADIMKYRDSVMQSVLKDHKVSEGYGIKHGKLDKIDTSIVSFTLNYEENYYYTNKDNVMISTKKSFSGGSKTATMITQNQNIMVKTGTKNVMKLDDQLKGNFGYIYKMKSESCHQSGNSMGGIPEEAILSFTLDKISNIGSIGGGGKTKTLKSGNCIFKDSRSSSVEMEDFGFGLSTDPSKAILPDDVKARNMDNRKGICDFIKTKNGYKVSYSYTDIQESNSGEKISTTTMLTAFIGLPDKKYEAVIMPIDTADYRRWVPKGPNVNGSDLTKGDRTRKFKVIVRETQDKNKIYHQPYTVTWKLKDVSKYPGICNNYPEYTENPDVSVDLKFDDTLKTQKSEFEPNITDGEVKTIKGKGENAIVTLNCMDYAAWGKLEAEVTLDDGTFIDHSSAYYDEASEYITVPFDKNENKVSDYWERKNKVLDNGHDILWDEDNKPEDQKDNGDGYTVFEEYRGFAMYKKDEANPKKKDFHQRTDPFYKDVFIYDEGGLFKKYYEPQNPSKLAWHYLKKEQLIFLGTADRVLPKHRRVNFNKVDDYFYAYQHAAVLIENTGSNPCGYGNGQTAAGISYGEDEYRYCNFLGKGNTLGTPGDNSPFKYIIQAVIYTGHLNKLSDDYHDPIIGDAVYETQMGITIKHEMGHYLGMPHHGDSRDVKQGDSTCELKACGAIDCIMRYPGSPRELNNINMRIDKTHYCRKSEPGVYFWHKPSTDASGNPELKYIKVLDISNWNCFGRITVKSRP